MQRYFFISYNFTTKTENGSGRCFVRTEDSLYPNLDEVEAALTYEDITATTVINITELTKEDYEKNLKK